MDESKPAAAPADPAPPVAQTPSSAAKTDKAQRLAAALRDNLKRRKAASRTARVDTPRN